MSKPRIAIFDFACCEGCQLQIVNLEEEILDLIRDPVTSFDIPERYRILLKRGTN